MRIEDLVEKYQKVKVDEIAFSKIKKAKKILVSVIVITYNHEKYIKQCLDSVLSQKTSFEFEILIGEDDSKDKTRDICLEYAKKSPKNIRIFLHSRKNVIRIGGKPTGRFNLLYLLSKAKGKYIALLEGDDYWIDMLKLEKQVRCFEKDILLSECFNPVYIVDENSNIVKEYYGPIVKKEYYGVKDLLIYGNIIPTSSIMFKRKNIKDVPTWFIKTPVGDWPLNIISGFKGKIKMINEKMSVWRQHKDGVFSLKKEYYKLNIELKTLYIYRKVLDAKYEKKINNKISRILLHFYLNSDVKIDLYKLRKMVIPSFFSGFVHKRLRIINLKLLFAAFAPNLYKKLKRSIKK
jgi:glycosyltransferase involved in cell wall biosynthesis